MVNKLKKEKTTYRVPTVSSVQDIEEAQFHYRY